uniref:Uncharacterized protein n=1 Tax=Chromera velia CCMP2878 TaxID=1169474 RepID=A0A0G4F5K2_9ALVE|eukprot:Cvel_15210.t1-p1 / transcript=Cvel_15210.t1 / gene=Cvel_15210 / organism=Chromera_velia_CCMP2878 / gene_product=hypothetical protein / transcript_product=hypothetical protein / location=Cvel_scaffold1112:50998-52845(-) / protein_length=616 / sequence_SO=supercontig / SO=protein_coding / is_pseudo=false
MRVSNSSRDSLFPPLVLQQQERRSDSGGLCCLTRVVGRVSIPVVTLFTVLLYSVIHFGFRERIIALEVTRAGVDKDLLWDSRGQARVMTFVTQGRVRRQSPGEGSEGRRRFEASGGSWWSCETVVSARDTAEHREGALVSEWREGEQDVVQVVYLNGGRDGVEEEGTVSSFESIEGVSSERLEREGTLGQRENIHLLRKTTAVDEIGLLLGLDATLGNRYTFSRSVNLKSRLSPFDDGPLPLPLPLRAWGVRRADALRKGAQHLEEKTSMLVEEMTEKDEGVLAERSLRLLERRAGPQAFREGGDFVPAREYRVFTGSVSCIRVCAGRTTASKELKEDLCGWEGQTYSEFVDDFLNAWLHNDWVHLTANSVLSLIFGWWLEGSLGSLYWGLVVFFFSYLMCSVVWLRWVWTDWLHLLDRPGGWGASSMFYGWFAMAFSLVFFHKFVGRGGGVSDPVGNGLLDEEVGVEVQSSAFEAGGIEEGSGLRGENGNEGSLEGGSDGVRLGEEEGEGRWGNSLTETGRERPNRAERETSCWWYCFLFPGGGVVYGLLLGFRVLGSLWGLYGRWPLSVGVWKSEILHGLSLLFGFLVGIPLVYLILGVEPLRSWRVGRKVFQV